MFKIIVILKSAIQHTKHKTRSETLLTDPNYRSRKNKEKLHKRHQILEHPSPLYQQSNNPNNNCGNIFPGQSLNIIVTPVGRKVAITDVGQLSALLNDLLHTTNGLPTTASPRFPKYLLLEVGECAMSFDNLI